jgi:hypothetical protein
VRALTTRYARLRALEALSNATDDQWKRGLAWYPQARDFVADVQRQYPHYLSEQIAALVAVTSPMVRWSLNQKTTLAYCEQHSEGVPVLDWTPALFVGENMRRAEQVLNGNLAVVSGQKVEAFFANLCGDDSRVTMDSWMTRALFRKDIPSVREARAGQAAIARVAEETDIAPSGIQAVIWTWTREKK